MNGFRKYNKEEIFNILDELSIKKSGENLITTEFKGRILNTTRVSNRYEIFDIVKYLKDKINIIELNFPIHQYKIKINGGKQTLQLISDRVEIGGVDFYKSFFILNSTDKSRRLSFNVGLKSDSRNFYLVGNNAGLTKKHLKGVTQAAEKASEGINGETFDQQIKSINSIIGHRIKFSKIREIILGERVDFKDVTGINHRKFDAFKNTIRWTENSDFFKINSEQRNFLYKPSDTIKEITNDLDFFIDAFWVLQMYLRIFNKQDAHIVKKESERIMRLTQWAVRNSVLESIGI
jgi:hypothetical protein